MKKILFVLFCCVIFVFECFFFENQITICICDHQARDLLTCVDVAMVLSEGKVIAKGTPTELVKNQNAKTAYFGDSFKFN